MQTRKNGNIGCSTSSKWLVPMLALLIVISMSSSVSMHQAMRKKTVARVPLEYANNSIHTQDAADVYAPDDVLLFVPTSASSLSSSPFIATANTTAPHITSIPDLHKVDNRTFYCQWRHKGTLKQCFRLISKRLQTLQQSSRAVLRPPTNTNRTTTTPWVYLGDSTINHLFQPVVEGLNKDIYGYSETSRSAPIYLQSQTTLQRINADRCGSLNYLGYNGTATAQHLPKWTPPDQSNGEGPAAFGLTHPFCPDAAFCDNQLHSLDIIITPQVGGVESAKNVHHSATLEFLTVEFALDVSLPTATTRTTQETVVKHLQRQQQSAQEISSSGAICVVNTGVHDMAVPNITTSLYVRNVRRYWDLLLRAQPKLASTHPVCAHLIWVSLSSIKNWASRPQRNWKLKHWNQKILNILSTEGDEESAFFRDHVTFVDIWHKSSKTKHADNVHLDDSEYYEPLSELFINLTLKHSIL